MALGFRPSIAGSSPIWNGGFTSGAAVPRKWRSTLIENGGTLERAAQATTTQLYDAIAAETPDSAG